MNKQELLKTFVLGINSDLQGYDKLKSLLLVQQKMILRHKASDLVLLNKILSKKIIELDNSAQTRQHIVEKFGLSNKPHSIEIIINTLPPKMRVKVISMWEALESRVKDSKKVNDINGSLLAMQKESITSLLSEEQFDYGHLTG